MIMHSIYIVKKNLLLWKIKSLGIGQLNIESGKFKKLTFSDSKMSRRGRYRKFRPNFEPEPWYTDGSENDTEPVDNPNTVLSNDSITHNDPGGGEPDDAAAGPAVIHNPNEALIPAEAHVLHNPMASDNDLLLDDHLEQNCKCFVILM